MTGAISLVGVPEPAAALVRRGIAVADEAATVLDMGADDAIARLEHAPDAFDAVVVWDPAGATGAAFAQRVARHDRDLSVVVVTPPDATASLRRALRFAPFLGEEVTGWSSEELELVGPEIADAASRTRRRRSHRTVVARASEQLAAAPARRPGGYVENLLRHAPIGVVTLDPSGTVMACNVEAARLLGVDRETAAGRPFDELVPGNSSRIRRLVAAPPQAADAAEVVEIPGEGAPRHLEISANRHFGPDEEPLTVVVVTDVTARERAAARLRHLQSVTDAALTHLDIDALLDELLTRIRTALRVDTVAVLLTDPDAEHVLRMRASQGLDDELRDFSVPIGKGFAGRIAQERRPIKVPRVERHHVVSPVFGATVASLLGVPLVVGRRLIGVLHVGSVDPRDFDDDDQTLLELVATRVALAINQARSYAQEHETAVILQRSLLPDQLPEVPSLGFAAAYRPAGPTAEVGGDWYDVIELGGSQVGISIGDVVGRGLKAASVMGQLRAALRAYAVEGHPPGEAIRRLNDLMLHGGGGLATAVHGVWDPRDAVIHLAVAGHPPPLVVTADGDTRFVEGGGAALGVVPFAAYEEITVPLAPGDRIILYTDGLVERRDEILDAGLARLAAAAARAPAGAQPLVDALVRELLGDDDADDAAALVVEALPLGARLELELPANPAALADARTQVHRWMLSRGAPPHVAVDMVIACGEACSNVIEHAYGPGKASFRLEAEEQDGDAILVVRDFGSWREQRHVGRGRGRTLMRALADDVTFDSDDGGTTVRMRRRLERSA